MFIATFFRCCHFGSVSAVKKACRPEKHSLFSVARATIAPDIQCFKNFLLRPKGKFSKQIWRSYSKQCSNNQRNLTNQPPGQKYRPEIPITTDPVPHSKHRSLPVKDQNLASPSSFLYTYFVPKSVFP